MLFSWVHYFYGVNCIAGFLAAGLSQCTHNQQVYLIHFLMNYLIDVDITCGVCFSNIAGESITSPCPSHSAENSQCRLLTLFSLVWNLNVQSVGRECRWDAEYPDPSLRSRAAPPLQQRHDGDVFQGPLHRRVGHGLPHRHHPEEGAGRPPSRCQRRGLWWQVHCVGIRWQNYKGELFQRLFICSSGVFINNEQWPDRENGPWQDLPLEVVLFLLLLCTCPSSVELAQLFYRAYGKSVPGTDAVEKEHLFPVFLFDLTTSITCSVI